MIANGDCRKRKQISLKTACVLSGLLLLLAAAGLAVHNLLEDHQAGVRSQELLAQVETSQRDLPIEGTNLSSAETISPTEEESTKATAPAGYNVAAILSLPDLGITLPVLKECSDDLLKVSPCVFTGSWEDGPEQLIIAGHNYYTHFKDIGELPVGAKITFQTLDGTEYTLSIMEISAIGVDEPEKLEADQWDLTLLTCNFDRTKRILVRCQIV